MKYCLISIVIVMLLSCSISNSPTSNSDGMQHDAWSLLLSKHVDENGWVNYKGFVADSIEFNKYLKELSDNAPSAKWRSDEKLAYWINAYNAFTVKLIADNYPVKSIRELGPSLSIPGVNTVWHRKFFKIGDEEFNLDRIEHQILRKEFMEPRIHFAIVCASISCPRLLNESYEAGKLENQLTQQTLRFLEDKSRNTIGSDHLELSKIFSWFKGDFTKEGSVIDFLNKYVSMEIKPDATIEYTKYDWGLNEQ